MNSVCFLNICSGCQPRQPEMNFEIILGFAKRDDEVVVPYKHTENCIENRSLAVNFSFQLFCIITVLFEPCFKAVYRHALVCKFLLVFSYDIILKIAVM